MERETRTIQALIKTSVRAKARLDNHIQQASALDYVRILYHVSIIFTFTDLNPGSGFDGVPHSTEGAQGQSSPATGPAPTKGQSYWNARKHG